MNIKALLGEMILADGKIKDIEKINAEAYLEALQNRFRLNDVQIQLPEFAPLKRDEDMLDAIIAAFEPLTIAEKLDILRSMWAIAICDGELHSQEEMLIYRFIDAANMPRWKANETMAETSSLADDNQILKSA